MIWLIKNTIKKIKFCFISKIKKSYIGKKCNIAYGAILEGGNVINDGTSLSGRLGYGSVIGNNCYIIDAFIGKYCSIGSDVKIITGRHPKHFVSTHPSFYSLRKQSGFTYVNKQLFDDFNYADRDNGYSVIIGNDVWVGSGVSILEGVKISDGAILAAGALVTKDVESYTIYAGTPAKKIGQRFEDSIIQKLDTIKWWNRDEKWIKTHANLFSNIDNFMESVDRN